MAIGLALVVPPVSAHAVAPSPSPTPTATPVRPTRTPERGALPGRAKKNAGGSGSASRVAAPAGAPVAAPQVLAPVLDPIPAPIVVGATTVLTGSAFTAGSVIIGFVITGVGVQSIGPITPQSWTPTALTWPVSPSIPLGQGFIVLAIVNTDQGYAGSEYRNQRLYGDAQDNIPTILSVNGNAIQGPDASLNGIYVNGSVFPGNWVPIGGTGFNNPGVNFYTAGGNIGPLQTRNVTGTQMEALVPGNAPTGLGAFELVNSPYTGNVGSQVVYVTVGDAPNISGISLNNGIVTVNGSGFAQGAVLNLFNQRGQMVSNLGSVYPTNGQARVPATVVSPNQLTFAVPPDAITGSAYVQVINPPYIGFSSTGSDPQGGFTIVNTMVARGGSSLRFFGASGEDVDRVKIPLGNTDPGKPVDVGGDFTLEFWMKTAAGNASGSCVAGSDNWINGNIIFDRDVFGDGDDGDFGVSLFGTGGRIAFGVDREGVAGTTVCGATNVANGAWHHVAVTRAGATLRIFVDGQLDGSAANGPTGDVGYDNGRATSFEDDPFLVIGAEKHDADLDQFPSYHGWIDEVRISNGVRYTGAFSPPTAPFVPDPNTVALYHFDEGNGNIVTDSSYALGGSSDGTRAFGGNPAGPQWSPDTPFTSNPPTIALEALPFSVSGATVITHAGDNRLFIAEQAGVIRIWDGTQLLATPFLTIPANLIAAGGERGLLGVAFHPQYASNGLFFVSYTNAAGDPTVVRYRVSGNPNVANAASAVTLLTVAQYASNHNGGNLVFGPDGYLYIGKGDGGGGCDDQGQTCNAQRDNLLLGKMLRVDVDQNVNSPPFYGIPPDNPFVGPGDPLDEIWAEGLRNPWRYSFDRLTGSLFIADVGQGSREEVNIQPFGGGGGRNYGWKIMEGTLCGTCSTVGCPSIPACNSPALTMPILEYDHGSGCSITGGHVYRGSKVPYLYGKYVYGDLCSGTIWWGRDNGGPWGATPFSTTAPSLFTFGEDVWGEIYLSRGSTIYRIRASS